MTFSTLETKYKQLSSFNWKIIISKPISVLSGLRRRIVAVWLLGSLSKPADDMDVRLGVCCVLYRQQSLRPADRSLRGALASVCVCDIGTSEPGSLDPNWAVAPQKRGSKISKENIRNPRYLIKYWRGLKIVRTVLLVSFPCKLNTFRKRLKNVVTSKRLQVGIQCK